MRRERPYPPNLALKHAIIDSRLEHRQVAHKAKTSAQTLGGVLSGRVRPSASLRARLALALNRDEHELFPEQVSV